jgi:hypothetical protein
MKKCLFNGCNNEVFRNQKYCCDEHKPKSNSYRKKAINLFEGLDLTDKEKAKLKFEEHKEQERTKYDGTVDKKWLSRGKISDRRDTTRDCAYHN